MVKKQKIAVVLLNMGGPKTQKDVRPFLQNLFSDPAIISLPFAVRHLLAAWISRRREQQAKENYQLMGGGSPIVAETELQQKGLQKTLQDQYPQYQWKCVIAMRYWFPRTMDAQQQLQDFAPEKVILLPLYPQFSSTTSGSSFKEWHKQNKHKNWKTSQVRCYADDPVFVRAHVNQIITSWKQAGSSKNIRVLFSAHGLPEKIIKAGDPYQSQIETSVGLIAKQLPRALLEHSICYQSRVGRLKWIGPSTIEEITKAGSEGKNLLIVPIAFVSEHIETLVELDVEYAKLAKQTGVKQYIRVPTLRDDPLFLSCLAEQVGAKI